MLRMAFADRTLVTLVLLEIAKPVVLHRSDVNVYPSNSFTVRAVALSEQIKHSLDITGSNS